jgi:uncharacterized protein (TIGR03118 family)
MSFFRFLTKWLRGSTDGGKKMAPRLRLALEALEERRVLSANFIQTNLVSDLPGLAQVRDLTLVNPSGISLSPNGGAFWVSSDGTNGISELYIGDINGNPIGQPFKVNIPGGSPSGQVFNPNQPVMANGNSNDFSVTDGTNTAASVFIFATRTGRIVGWAPAVGGQIPLGGGTISGNGITAFQARDGASYRGLAIGTFQNANFLYAADFRNGKIDVIDGQFRLVAPNTQGFGAFADPNLPAGFAPLSIANIGGQLFVTYARRDANNNPVAGAGQGFVDVFDTGGNLVQRLVSNGPLKAPTAVVMAPGNFGTFSNALLVGNNGDGLINAFNPTTGAFLGQLQDVNGNAVHVDGLQALSFGNGVSSGPSNVLFFTSALNGGADGLFGSLQATAAGGANARFIDQLYQDMLNRQAAPSELALWQGQLDKGATRAMVAGQIENSTEHLGVLVGNAYQQFLHRAADPGAVAVWTTFLLQGHTVEQMEAGIAGSPEYFQTRGGGTNAGFLGALFQDAIGRAIDGTNQNVLGLQLTGGVTRGQVASEIFATLEFQQDLVMADYQLFLDRLAAPAEVNAFVAAIQQGQTDQQIAAAIAGSDEYFARL